MSTFVMKFYAVGSDSSFLSTVVVIAADRISAINKLEDEMSQHTDNGIVIVKVNDLDQEGVYFLGC